MASLLGLDSPVVSGSGSNRPGSPFQEKVPSGPKPACLKDVVKTPLAMKHHHMSLPGVAVLQRESIESRSTDASSFREKLG